MTNVAWLAVTGGASGTSNGVVTFSAAVNAGTTARTGGVIVAGGGITRTCTVVQAAMPLANDTCPGAISLADNLTYSLNTATATDDSTPGRGAINKGVWFTFTPSVTGTATVDTCTSDFDTVIEAMSGACGVPIAIANNDDNGPACTGSKASVSIACTAGATYLICAGGYSGSSGNLSVLAHAVAAVAALGISPTSTNISSAAAGQLSIGVTANISWTATTNAAWLAVTGGSPGSNNGTVFFSVATNTGTSARTGGVIVAGGGIARTCTVVQAGTPVQRIIGLSGNMAFGNVVTGKTKTALLTITNSGNTALAVTGIGYPAGFSGAWSGSVAAGQSTNMTVTFAPLLVQAYGGTATVASDATGGTGTIAVSGTGIGAHPQAQAGENFGVLSNRFGFSINWASGQVVVVDACTNLINPVWSPLQTNVLSNTPTYFSDPKWTNLLGRFYRIRAP